MGIQFILGASGSGKSTYIYNQIIEKSMLDETGMYYLIVPEQYTLEAQRDIVTMHPKHGTMNIDAIGFNRLAYRVFDELGINTGQVLMDFGKSMLVKKIMWENRDSLKVYGSSISKMGFIDEMKSMMSELFQYAADTDSLSEVKDKLEKDSMLYDKLEDILLIYQEFESFTGSKYIVAEKLTEMLADNVKDSEIIAKSTFYIDGFTGFTPIQMNLIGELIRYAKDVYISLTIDTGDISLSDIREHELFYLTKTTMKNLNSLAINAKAEISEPVLMDCEAFTVAGNNPTRFANAPDIAFLEKNIFRYPYDVKKGSLHNIELVSAYNIRQEIQFIASEIIRLVYEEGYRYKDIAVVSGDLNESRSLFADIMKEYRIPIFIDANEPLKNNPCSELIRSVLAIFYDNFSYDSIFRFLKTGMTQIECSDIENLENYVLKRGIRGRNSWNKSFCVMGEDENLSRLEETRQQLMDILVDISQAFYDEKSTVKDYTIALYEFINKQDIFERLNEHAAELDESGEQRLSDIYGGIYKKVIDLFDKTIELLGDEQMDIREYYEVIDAGLSSIEIGTVPPTVDRVLIGDITRSRLNHVKVIFFSGVNDGIIPKPAKSGRILNDSDRKHMAENGFFLAPSDRQNTYIEQFYLYLNITKASDKLYLSYRKSDDMGKGLKPSYFINRIRHIFPDMEVRDYSPEEEYICTPEGVLRRLLRDGEQKKANHILKKYGYDRELSAYQKGMAFEMGEEKIDSETAELLYGRELVESVSRLETFAGCPYSYFLRYGLGLKERKLYDADVRDVGNLLHSVMEKVFVNVRDYHNNDWSGLKDSDRDEIVEAAVSEAAAERENTFFYDMERNRYMLKILKRMAGRTVWTMQKQLNSGIMRPEMIEKVFDSKKDGLNQFVYRLNNNMTMRITGRIDRVDVCRQGDTVYFKVVDYKSSSKSLDLQLMEEGLQLQLVTYSAVVYELEKNIYKGFHVAPAGLMYYSFDDPIVEVLTEPEWEGDRVFLPAGEADDDNRLEKLEMTGLVNNNPEVISLMDRNGKCLKPVRYGKNGEIKDNGSLKSEIELIELMENAGEKIYELGSRIAEGDIAAAPSKIKDNDACRYCRFSNICGIKMNRRNTDNGFDKGTKKDSTGKEL